jgi:hypothetical protein
METNLEERRKAAIDKRRSSIPKDYRRTCDNAVAGKSLRAAINAQCMGCVGWQRLEVHRCTSLACPLWAVRPYQEINSKARNERDLRAESTQIEQPIPG